MVIRLPELLLFAEDVWKKALGRLGPATDKHAAQSKHRSVGRSGKSRRMTSVESPAPPPCVVPVKSTAVPVTPTAGEAPAATTTTTTTTMAPSATGGSGSAASATKKRCWRRRTVHFTVFLAVFSTILSLLWVYTLAAEMRRKAFDVNMTRDYILDHISMDNPYLVAYIRDFQLKTTEQREALNVTQTPEEEFVANQLQGKREGVYFEYMSRVGAASTTAWLEASLGWRGVAVFMDPRSYSEAFRSIRNPKTRVLHACLSTDKDTREITYHQEADVLVTKLGEGPNSLPVPRLFCFPLYSILLAYNTTTVDYLSLDSTEVQDGLVLDTIPWDMIRISVLAIHWGAHHTDAETKSIVDKLASHNYKLIKSLATGKLVFLYNRRLKI